MKTYFGENLSLKECELRAVKNISHSILRTEQSLFKTKWFDYRDLHPTKATYLFAHLYKERYSRMYAKTRCHKTAQFVTGVSGGIDFLNPRGKKTKSTSVTGFWKARQHADRLGVPYDKYIWYAMMCVDETMWKRIPTPAQLYSPAILEYVERKWQEDVRNGIFTSKYDLNSNSPIGIEYQHWLCKVLRKRQNVAIALAGSVFKQKTLTTSVVSQYFSREELRRAWVFYNTSLK